MAGSEKAVSGGGDADFGNDAEDKKGGVPRELVQERRDVRIGKDIEELFFDLDLCGGERTGQIDWLAREKERTGELRFRDFLLTTGADQAVWREALEFFIVFLVSTNRDN